MKRLLDFYADWCGPCKLMNPVLDTLSQEFTIEKINVDKAADIAAQHNVMGIPTYIIMDGDEEIIRFSGYTPIEKLRKAMQL